MGLGKIFYKALIILLFAPLQSLMFAQSGGGDISQAKDFLSILENLNSCEDENAVRLRLSEELGRAPVHTDWLIADLAGDFSILKKSDSEKIDFFDGLSKRYAKKLSAAQNTSVSQSLEKSILQYLSVRKKNRERIFKNFSEKFPHKYVYVERTPITPSFYAYTEGLSDARGEKHFLPNSKLCLLKFDGGEFTREILLESKDGTIRDTDVSYDAKKILFAWKKNKNDDYSLYEMDLDSRDIRLIAKSEKQADFEGKYLPTGEIIFSSTRCEQSTDCWNTEVSNLYLMRPDGTAIRRVGFDQVHTTYPTVCENGDVVYTRWDYNDRGQIFTQALFKMKPDGSFQRELYGNKSWAPTAIGHARQIPNNPKKFVCIYHGHHTPQQGKLGIIDTSKGRQEGEGAHCIAPVAKIPKAKDGYAQDGVQFRYPYPLCDGLYLASANVLSTDFDKSKFNRKIRRLPFRLYLIDDNGEREILLSGADSSKLSQMQIVPVAKRKIPELEKSKLDYSSDKGYCLIRNIYVGQGTKGLKKGDIKKVRVVKLHYRRAPVGRMYSASLDGAGNASSFTPIALGNGSWDVKEILGEVPVEQDGSVYFEVPARTPLYFQLIDKNGCVASTMRSWTAMQPDEFYACMGCHGNRDENSREKVYLDPERKPKKLEPFYDVRGGFSFRKVIQPILDNHCIRCHNDRESARLLDEKDFSKKKSVQDYAPLADEEKKSFVAENKNALRRAFSLMDVPIPNTIAKRNFNDSYYNLLRPSMKNKNFPFLVDYKSELVNWVGAQSAPPLLAPYTRGSATSKLYMMLRDGHSHLNLSSEELNKICAWIDLCVPYCGDYWEANIWSEKEKEYYKYYEDKGTRSEAAELEQIKKYLLPSAKK